MPRPWLVAVDEDPGVLGDLQRELNDRYGRHYEVGCFGRREEALAHLRELAGSGEQVALVLAGQWLSGMTGSELLGEVRGCTPTQSAGWSSRGAAGAIRRRARRSSRRWPTAASTSTCSRPSGSPDELFHQAVSGFLLEWAEGQRTSPAHDPRGRRDVVGPGL